MVPPAEHEALFNEVAENERVQFNSGVSITFVGIRSIGLAIGDAS